MSWASRSSQCRFHCMEATQRRRAYRLSCTYTRITVTQTCTCLWTHEDVSGSSPNGAAEHWTSLFLSSRRPALNGNTTLSFLITTDVDIGELMMVTLRWEKDAYISWSDWWGSSQFHIRKLRIKSGETQSKWVVCHQHTDTEQTKWPAHISAFWLYNPDDIQKGFFPLYVISGFASMLGMESLPSWSGEGMKQSLSSQKKTTGAVEKDSMFQLTFNFVKMHNKDYSIKEWSEALPLPFTVHLLFPPGCTDLKQRAVSLGRMMFEVALEVAYHAHHPKIEHTRQHREAFANNCTPDERCLFFSHQFFFLISQCNQCNLIHSATNQTSHVSLKILLLENVTGFFMMMCS